MINLQQYIQRRKGKMINLQQYIQRTRVHLPSKSIKEAFDHLPTGVYFFLKNGIPILCNLRMRHLVYELAGRDVQSLSELNKALEKPCKNVKKDGTEYLFLDDTAWYFAEKSITDKYGEEYIQITASDVTELHKKRKKLAEENEQLLRIQKNLRQLSENVAAQTREREVLSMKMRVHDDVGSSMLAVHQILRQKRPISDADNVVLTWERAINLLRRTNDEEPEKNEMKQIMELSQGLGLEITVTGEMPEEGDIAYLLTTAVRECVTNAVRYAEAKQLNVMLQTANQKITAVITNDGKIPAGKVAEGGGLSMLRRRVEYAGGIMRVMSQPEFQLIIVLPEPCL